MRDIIYVQWPELEWMSWWMSGWPWSDHYMLMRQGYDGDDSYAYYYRQLCKRMTELFGEALICQRIPTLRHYKAKEKAPYKWHDDTAFGHPAPLYSLWIPFTHVPAGVLETVHQCNKAMKPGEALIFESSRPHTVHPIPVERVSIDARFIPAVKYKEPTTPEHTKNTDMLIRLGDYYFHSDELCPTS